MTQLLQNAAYGTALILAAALLRKVLKERLIPGARLALWGACLFRLLTPAAPESVLSLWGLSRLFEAPAPAPASVPASQLYIPPQAVPAPQPTPGISWETVLFAAWLAVGAVLAVRYVLSWSRTRRAVSCAVPLNSRDPRYALLPKCARLREGPIEGAPLTFGVAKPTVVLTPGLDGKELDCVLAHEGVHASRRDNLWHYVMAVALVVHWWNPAVWLMSRLLRRDIELSCDRAALKKLGGDRRADYAQALVSLATQGSDPDFCQTFGRKAVEERIRSIMKFKKTSVIGVIFSLALVLAVTAAFASEPKQPDEDSSTSSYGSSRAWSMSIDADNALKDFSINLDYLEENLAQHVADGTMSQEEADHVLAKARQIAQNGELHWTFPADSGLVNDHFDANGDYRPGFNVFYKDPDGNMFAVDPATVVSSFIFRGGIDQPTYVEEGEDLLVAGLIGESWISYDGGNPVHNIYEVHLPTFDEDGNPEDHGITGARLMELDEYKALLDKLVADGKMTQADADHRHTGAKEGLERNSGNLYVSDSGGWVIMSSYLCTLPDCDDYAAHKHGEVLYSGHIAKSTDSSPAPSEYAYPRNSKGETYGPDMLGMEEPDLISAMGTKGEEGYIRASDGPGADVTNPQEAMAYMRWRTTQPAEILIPLYDSEGNVIGQFAVENPMSGQDIRSIPCGLEGCAETRYHTHNEGRTILLSDPCPVEGCTIMGNHLHGDVCYSCSGAGHSRGYCDGSCYTSTSLPQYVNSSTHHSESHHGNGHH